MPGTLDEFPGEGIQESLLLEDEGLGLADIEGRVRYSGGRFSMFDSSGEFDPRAGSAVYGTERAYQEVEAETATTSTAFITRVTLTTPALPGVGLYRIAWYCELRYNRTNRDWRGRILQDGATTVAEINVESSDVGTWRGWSGFQEDLALSAGAHTFELQWAREASPGSAGIRRARLAFIRVA